MLGLRHWSMYLAAATLATLPVSSVAQNADSSGLSADELLRLFQSQSVKTRGLVLAPTQPKQTGDGTVSEASATAAVTEIATETYVELAPEQQVNIQITFDFDSAVLRDDQKSKLVTLCEVMKTVNIARFRIVGHTDASGTAEYNQRLSLLRAEEVRRHLVTDCGVAEVRLEAVGVGEAWPLDKDDPNSDINRRVEFQAAG